MKPLLHVETLSKHFETLKAVNQVDFSIYPGEVIGLVGESGCGKSTLGRLLAGIETPTEGSVFFEGENLHLLNRKKRKERRKDIQVVFQDPYASLNPKMNVFEILQEPFLIHNISHSRKTILDLLSLVHLSTSLEKRFPHELSGGQRQRIGIARALALSPKFLICDEPISSLDVSIGAQILNLLKGLQKELGLTILFIAHDLRAVKYLSSRIFVMYLGKLVELGNANSLYKDPVHPYTKALLSAVPIPDPHLEKTRKRILLQGESSFEKSVGCLFAPRCPFAEDNCHKTSPKLTKISAERDASCHLLSPFS
jgi:oligopeptide/dipeptide ABC transporter ATP-binding protein